MKENEKWISCDDQLPPLDSSGAGDIVELKLIFAYDDIYQEYTAEGMLTDDGVWLIPEFPKYNYTPELKVVAWREMPL